MGAIDKRLFAVDTHARIIDNKGNTLGCVAVFDENLDKVEHLCSWLRSGLAQKGVKKTEPQSFAIILR